MSPQLTLSLFPTSSSQGLALQKQLVRLAEERGLTVKVDQNADSMKYLHARHVTLLADRGLLQHCH